MDYFCCLAEFLLLSGVLSSSSSSSFWPFVAEIARYKFDQSIRLKDPRGLQGKQVTLTSLPPLEMFIKQTVIDSNTPLPNLFIALVYLDRFGAKLAAKVNGAYDSRHRIFLACLVVACKFLNDVAYKNGYWSALWREFTVDDVNLMERELLVILNFDLTILPKDIENLMRRYFRADEARRLEQTLFSHQPWYNSSSRAS